MADIGEPLKRWEIEPLDEPVSIPVEEPAKKEPVPAGR